MTSSLESQTLTMQAPLREIPRAAWRVAGGLAIAHVVVTLAGASQIPMLEPGAPPDVVQRTLAAAPVGWTFAGAFVEVLGTLLLLPVFVFLTRTVGRRTEWGRWATQTALVAGVGNVAVNLATGWPAGAAALTGAHNGVTDAATLSMVNDIRNFSFQLALVALGVHALATGLAAVNDAAMHRWVGWGGILVGALLVVGVAAQGVAVATAQFAMMLWFVWWVGLGVVLIRRGSAKGFSVRQT